jgi:putative phosphoesterase
MRLAFVSDLHANFEAVRQLEDILHAVDRVVCLGDFVGYYCQVNEVFDFIRPLNPLAILGNHDRFLLNGCPGDVNAAVRFGVEYAARVIHPAHREYLEALPWCWGGTLDGMSFLLAHGSPWRPLEDYLTSGSSLLMTLDRFDYDVIVVGQTHRVMQNTDQRPWLLNPGSVGQSRDLRAQACALVLDTATMQVAKIQKNYDADPVVELARRNGAGSWITKHLE